MKKLLVIIIGLILFLPELTSFGGGNYAEKYLPYVFVGAALGLVILLLRRR